MLIFRRVVNEGCIKRSVHRTVEISTTVPVSIGGWSAAHKQLLSAGGHRAGAGSACIEGTVLVPQFSPHVPVQWAAQR